MLSENVSLTAEGRRLVAKLQAGQRLDDLAKQGLSAEVTNALVKAGLLQVRAETALPLNYQEVYAGWRSQKGMLIDDPRTLAFERAIQTVVKPGDRVVDVGTGSGILSMFAARSGAGKVFALEYTSMADWARKLAEVNGLTAMQVVHGDATKFEGDGPVDVVMGEFAGMWLIEEWWHYAAFVKVRDKLLKPGGRVIPEAARLFLSAVDSRKLHLERGWGFFDAPVYGFDFSEVLTSGAYRPTRYIMSAEWKSLVCTKQIARFDYLTGTERDYAFTTEVQFDYPAGGMFHGFIGHFDLEMASGQVLSTSCGVRETCWHQSYFPMPALYVPPGQAVVARLRSYFDEVTNILMFAISVAGSGQSLDSQAEHVFAIE